MDVNGMKTPKVAPPVLHDGIADGLVYGAAATVVLGPIFAAVPAGRPLAAYGATVALNAAIFGVLDAVLTDRQPEALDGYLQL